MSDVVIFLNGKRITGVVQYNVIEGWVDVINAASLKQQIGQPTEGTPGRTGDEHIFGIDIPTKRLYGTVEEKCVILKSGANTIKEAEEPPRKG